MMVGSGVEGWPYPSGLTSDSGGFMAMSSPLALCSVAQRIVMRESSERKRKSLALESPTDMPPSDTMLECACASLTRSV